MKNNTACGVCGKGFYRRLSYILGGRMIRCSKKCSNVFMKTRVAGKKNHLWRGNKVGYTALHTWIKRHKEKSGVCECCKTNKPYDLANISQKYKRDVNDFEWLCRSCHMTKDGRMKNLHPTHPKTQRSEPQTPQI